MMADCIEVVLMDAPPQGSMKLAGRQRAGRAGAWSDVGGSFLISTCRLVFYLIFIDLKETE
jgi:hypothetical protein